MTSPLLIRYLRYLESDVGGLVARTENLLESRVGDKVPFMWVFDCFASYAGLREALAPDVSPPLSIGDLLINPKTHRNDCQPLRCFCPDTKRNSRCRPKIRNCNRVIESRSRDSAGSMTRSVVFFSSRVR